MSPIREEARRILEGVDWMTQFNLRTRFAVHVALRLAALAFDDPEIRWSRRQLQIPEIRPSLWPEIQSELRKAVASSGLERADRWRVALEAAFRIIEADQPLLARDKEKVPPS